MQRHRLRLVHSAMEEAVDQPEPQSAAPSPWPQLERFLTRDELAAFTGCGRTKIAEMIDRGEFPAPLRIGERRLVWRAPLVAEWQQKVIAENRRNG